MKAPLSSFIHDEFHFHSCRTYSQLWGANAGWHNGKTMSHIEQTDGSPMEVYILEGGQCKVH